MTIQKKLKKAFEDLTIEVIKNNTHKTKKIRSLKKILKEEVVKIISNNNKNTLVDLGVQSELQKQLHKTALLIIELNRSI